MERSCETVLILATLLVFSALFSCQANDGPGKIESTIAKQVKQKITIGGREWKNPVPDTPESRQEGGEHFQHHCEICHGLDGQNTGVPFAAKMDPPVPDLSTRDVQDYTDGQLKWIIQNGIAPSGMPGWNGILDENEMWNIVHFIRHLPQKGSQGVPEVYQQAEEGHQHGTAEKPSKKSTPHKHTRPHTHQH